MGGPPTHPPIQAYIHYRKGGIVPFFKNLKGKVLGNSGDGGEYTSVE